MASVTDLVNLNLSDCTDKIIAEYIWLASSPSVLALLSI
jgi:glutamine synthetase